MGWRCAKSLDQFIAEARELVPGGRVDTIGDADHSSRDSDHNPCDCHDAVCAGDVFTYQYDCGQLAENLRQRALGGDYRIKYVIFDRKIFSGPGQSYPAGSWRQYTGSNLHEDHLHLSIQHGSEQFDRTDRWNVFGPAGGAPPAIPAVEVIDVPIFVNLDTGQTVLMMSGTVKLASDADRKSLAAALEAAHDGNFGVVAKVKGGTAQQILALTP